MPSDMVRKLREYYGDPIVDQVFQYEAKIDGEWGCLHSADAIEVGRCPEIDPDYIDLLNLLFARMYE